MTGLRYLIEFFPKYSALIFDMQKSDFERDCVELLSLWPTVEEILKYSGGSPLSTILSVFFYDGVWRLQNEMGVKRLLWNSKDLKDLKYFCFTLQTVKET